MASSAASLRHLNRLVFARQTWRFKSSPEKTLATIAPQTNPGQAYRVDHRAMARWKLQESKLPADTAVMFKEPTIWSEHRGAVVAAYPGCCLAIVDRRRTAGSAAEKVARRKPAQGSEERMTFAAAAANIGLWQFDQHRNELWATEHCRAMFGIARDAPLTRDTFPFGRSPRRSANCNPGA
jgi:hypothetical protein